MEIKITDKDMEFLRMAAEKSERGKWRRPVWRSHS